MDLHRITERIATVIADLVMQIPVVVGRRNIVDVERLVGAVLSLADLPCTCTRTVKGRSCHLEVIAGTDGFGSHQHTYIGRRHIHGQLTGRLTIDSSTTTFNLIADIPTVVCRWDISQAESSVITVFR